MTSPGTSLAAPPPPIRPPFNDAFRRGDVTALAAVVHDDCLMVSAQPAPDGTAYVGKARASRSGPS